MKRVGHSDIVRYSDVKEDAIEIPRIFVDSRIHAALLRLSAMKLATWSRQTSTGEFKEP